MTHVMIDLETWSVRQGCAIAEIAVVPFEFKPKGRIYQEHTFHRYVLMQDGIGLVDNGTLMWWMSQGTKARKMLVDGITERGVPASEALTDLVTWPTDLPYVSSWGDFEGVWSNGAAQDIPWLEACFNRHGLPAPWSHKATRCFRTMQAISNPVTIDTTGFTEHHAPHDCVMQAMRLQQMIA